MSGSRKNKLTNKISIQEKVAKKAIIQTLEYVTYSSNQHSGKHYAHQESQLEKMRIQALKITAPMFSLQWIKENADLAKEYGTGNCMEKACVSISFAVEMFT
ncbi:MAG: hypothetical protein JO131_01490, partial [Gammaproteobacteria bacterium]|nr:hypothetical protein [Gammaproteobacteria bacterium]